MWYPDISGQVWDGSNMNEPLPGRKSGSVSRRAAKVPSLKADPGQLPIASIYAAASEQNPHVGSNPNILAGKPCINGTRIPVALVPATWRWATTPLKTWS